MTKRAPFEKLPGQIDLEEAIAAKDVRSALGEQEPKSKIIDSIPRWNGDQIESSSYHHDRFGLDELSAQVGVVKEIVSTAQGKALDAEEKARAGDLEEAIAKLVPDYKKYRNSDGTPLVESSSYHGDYYDVGLMPDPEAVARAADPLLAERGSSHGSWGENAAAIADIKRTLAIHLRAPLRPEHQEALDMIAVKIGRIITGNPDFQDHWDDIAGYAKLAATYCEPA